MFDSQPVFKISNNPGFSNDVPIRGEVGFRYKLDKESWPQSKNDCKYNRSPKSYGAEEHYHLLVEGNTIEERVRGHPDAN